MPDKTKNPFVVEIESDISDKLQETSDKLKVVAKEVGKTEEIIPKKVEKVVVNKPVVKQKRQWGMFFAGVATTLLLVAVGGGGWWWWQNKQIIPGETITPSPTPEAAVEVTQAPLSWSRELIAVDVLNASGVKGKASEVASQIQELGYKKGTTGNTASQTGSTLSLSEDVATLSATILAEIGEIVPGVTMTTTPLTGTNAMQLILGTE